MSTEALHHPETQRGIPASMKGTSPMTTTAPDSDTPTRPTAREYVRRVTDRREQPVWNHLSDIRDALEDLNKEAQHLAAHPRLDDPTYNDRIEILGILCEIQHDADSLTETLIAAAAAIPPLRRAARRARRAIFPEAGT